MLAIYDGRSHFWQWDTGQRLKVDMAGHACEVHYRDPNSTVALVVDTYELDGHTVADVPNILLQGTDSVLAWVYICEGDECTKHETRFSIYPRQKPADYVYTETEVKQFSALVKRLDEIEANGVSDEQVEKAVVKYLEENPIDTGVNFEVDEKTLRLEDGILSVNTTDQMEEDNTQPITSAGVYTQVGNINALLATI